jgi:serine protease Do
LEVGEWVVAVGSPFGLDSSVTQGIVSARGRSVTPRETGRSYEDYIQTDAAINPGNSGGPLLNLEGKIVGINTAIASRTGGYDGIGFAIPSNTARLVVENIRKHGRVLRGWLGVGLENSEEINGQSRVLVGSVQMGSPAAAAGLREGDVITRFQGVAMDEARMRNAIATLPAGSVVNIEVERGGAPVKLTAMLADRSANNTTFIEALGVEVVPVDERLSEELGFQGVMIWDTTADGRAANRFQKNDVIVAVDGDPVKNERDFAKAIEAADFQRGVRFNVLRPVQVRQGNRVETTFDRGRIDIRD